ncbi:hypothetical protein NFI96_020622 [Prochilodus magdalenae]|nr:hypothetical protein NFI96_020622 [Prochilodus magdalenae]
MLSQCLPPLTFISYRNFIDELDTLLSLFPVDGSPLLLLGDFNLPSDKLQSSCLQPLLSSFDLTLNPSPPTHQGGNTLDLVFSRPTPALDVTVTPLHCSDHYFLFFSLSPVQLFLSISPLHIPPSPGVTCTLSLLLLSLQPSTGSSPPAPWLSDVLRSNRRELRKAERKWRRSQLDPDLHTYQAILSRFSGEVTTAKSSFYKRKLEESVPDPRKLFSIFSSLLNPPSPPPPSSLTPEDFVTFFEEKVNKIRRSFFLCPHSSFNQSSSSCHKLLNLFFFSFFRRHPTATGIQQPHDLPTGSHPIHTAPVNLPGPATLHLLPYKLEPAPGHQSVRLPPAHSTVTALIAVTERLHAARSAKLSSVLILLDLSAAFDTANHKILLSVLTDLGITGTAWKWFESYLEDRHFQVAWNGSTSAPCRLSTDVPQGLLLGPFLFSLYTLSLVDVITSHSFSYHCYADDTQLMLSFPSSDTQVCNRISACLTDISSWMTAHHLKLNPSKTELLFIPSTTGPHCDLAISFGNLLITPTEDTRSLGVILDGQLSFSAHITKLTRSCRFFLYNIRRIRPFLSQEATQLLVQSLVISRLDYCNSLLAGLTLRAIRPLQPVQNAAAHLIFNLPKFTHVTPLLRSLHWLPCCCPHEI